MHHHARRVVVHLCAIALGLAVALPGAAADKHDRGKHAGREAGRPGVHVEVHIGDRERRIIADYFGDQLRAGRCPPGLAKKNNGCLPPGQAKKWARGHALPKGVVLHDLPADLVIRIGLPPAGYRYVRVANDVLLIALGTAIVVDAVERLGQG